MFWLFSDKLVFGELTSDQSTTFTLHPSILLSKCLVADEYNTMLDNPELAFSIVSEVDSFMAWAK
jgi:hypothetical protein